MAKYSKGAGKKVQEALHEMKRGKLKSGQSGKNVTSRKQAIAIGLSEAREKGEKVPKKGAFKSTGSKQKKSVAKSAGGKKAATKSVAKKSMVNSSGQWKKASTGGSKKAAIKKGATKSAPGRKATSKATSKGGGASRSAAGKTTTKRSKAAIKKSAAGKARK